MPRLTFSKTEGLLFLFAHTHNNNNNQSEPFISKFTVYLTVAQSIASTKLMVRKIREIYFIGGLPPFMLNGPLFNFKGLLFYSELSFIRQLLLKISQRMSFNANDFVSPYVTLEEVLEIKKAFDLFDRDLGGAIDPRELKVAINSLGIEAKAQAVYQMIAELDSDGSGQIEFPEFFYMMTTRASDNESRDEVHKVFVTFDSQKTGFIALKDLRKVAKDLGELTDDQTLQDMIERADADGDSLVSEQEFYNLITKKAH